MFNKNILMAAGANKKELEESQVLTDKLSPLILPDYRFEKALTTVQHIKGQ